VLLIISTYLFTAALDAPDSLKRWMLYVLVTALAVYCQLFAYLVVLAQWLSLRVKDVRLIGLRRMVFVGSALAVLTAPMVAFALFQNKGQLDWVQPLTSVRLLAFLRIFVGSAAATSAISSNTLLGFYAVLSVIGLATFHRQNSKTKRRGMMLVGWLILPITLIIVVSLRTPIFVDRFMLMCLPALLLLAAVGITRLLESKSQTYKAIAIAVVIALIGLSIAEDVKQYRALTAENNNWRNMTHV
jgi:mannosyltransferase